MKTAILKNKFKATKKASLELAKMSSQRKNNILAEIIQGLKKSKQAVLAANQKDLDNAKKNDLDEAFLNRLEITDKTFTQIINQVENIIKLKDPIGEKLEKRKLPNKLNIEKIRVPFGVLGVIYESRPNVTIDAAALAIKSGNAIVLKGGSDAINSNRSLAKIVEQALEKFGSAKEAVLFLDSLGREIVDEMLEQNDLIDVIIPRGGYGLVQKVIKKSKIPVLYHANGGARIYIDESADLDKALAICVNAKTSRPAACNSLDTVVVHQKIAQKFLPKLKEEFDRHKVAIKACGESIKIINVKQANHKDFRKEFLNLKAVIKIVEDLDEAIYFINRYTKKHSEGIVAKNEEVYKKFAQSIDAAALFVNSSTRFHDGGEFGLGAEMGIATGKLHARGPVGLRELTTYKWVVYGDGQVRG